MKKLAIFLLAVVGFLAGCEQEDFVGTGLEALSDFTINPLPESTVALSSVNPEEEIIISWNAANSGLNSEVSYTWQAYEQGSDPSNLALSIASDNNGTATTLTLTQQALDEALEGLGLDTAESITINWFVTATNGDITKQTNTSTVTIRRFINEIAPFDLVSPADGALVELNFEAPQSEVVVEWDSTYTGFETPITYRWLAVVTGGDFENPLLDLASDDMGSDFQITFTHQELDDILAANGVGEAEYLTLDWKVVASSQLLELESEQVFSVELRRFNPVASKFLVGAATPGGWSWDNPTEIVEVSEGVFQGTLQFNNDAFRVFETRDDWGSGRNYPYYVNEGFTIDDRFENANDGDQNFRFTGTPGEYTFTLDLNNKEIRLTVGDPIYLVGAATPGGWSWDNPTVAYQTSAGVWKATLNFSNEAFRFFTSNGDWGSGRNYPYYEGEGYTIDADFENANDGDQNFRFIGTPGEYTLTVDSNAKTIVLE